MFNILNLPDIVAQPSLPETCSAHSIQKTLATQPTTVWGVYLADGLAAWELRSLPLSSIMSEHRPAYCQPGK